MSMPPAATVVPILAIPFGIVPLPDAKQLNPSLLALCNARIAADTRSGAQNPLCYRSNDDLLEWSDAPVRQLSAALIRGLYSVVGSVNNFSEAQMRSFALQARAWFTLLRPDGGVAATSHRLTAWCAIYCIDAPTASASRADSGILRLYESRPGTSFTDASTAQMRLPYTPGHHGWRPVPGEMAVFPASLLHEIAPLRASGQLLLVTVRARFVGAGQQGMSQW